MKEIKGSTIRRRYARLPLALALGALVLTPAVIGVGAATAEASVIGKGETSITLSGDARIRGFWREDAAFGNLPGDDENRQLQHRMRLAVDIKAAGGTSLHGRLHFASADDPAGSQGTMYQWGGTRNNNVMTDYLYFRVPVAGATVTTGRQVVNWGHRMKTWDARADRLRVDYKLTDELAMFAYYQKDTESSPVTPTITNGVTDEDRNRYSLGANFGTPDLRVVLQLRHTDEEWTGGDDGQEFYGFATYKVADLTLSSEFDFRFGDVHETTNANGETNDPFAVYVGAAYALGDTTLTGGIAYAADGWTSGTSGHFDQITMFYNTSGGHGLGHSRIGTMSDDGELALGVGASHKLTPELTLGGKLAYIDGSNVTVNDDWSMVTAEASMAYKVNASTTYHIDAIYASPSFDAPGAQDDAYWGLSHRFELKF
ncbi:hypothetical protein ACHHRT_10475 [Desulfurivibrio sp. D14AmB]|uniref:hypothetical protein n=1 Tax=Desulfurivibrio sp. D14AmB TaxID=3374370 RepID=UPI00376F126A